MGLKTFRGNRLTLMDARIAKSYLDADELKMLSQLVSGYFDLAEASARQHVPTYMADYVTLLDTIMQAATGRPALEGTGSVSHVQAMRRAKQEYRRYDERTLNPIEVSYLESLKETQRKLEGRENDDEA